MIKVKKRDGNIVDFDITKIENAIAKAFESVNKNYSKDIIELLALKVTATFNDKIIDDVISVEEIQDTVEVENRYTLQEVILSIFIQNKSVSIYHCGLLWQKIKWKVKW